MLLHRREEPATRGRGTAGLARRPGSGGERGARRPGRLVRGGLDPAEEGAAPSHAVRVEGPRLAYFFADEATEREQGVAAGAPLIHNIGHGCRRPDPTPNPERGRRSLVEGRPVRAGGPPAAARELEREQVGRGAASASGHEETASAPPDPHHPISCCRYRVTRSTPRHRANAASYGSMPSPRDTKRRPEIGDFPPAAGRLLEHCLETEGRRRTMDTTGDGDVGEIETEDDEGCMIYPYECLTTKVEVYAPDISVTKRESYSADFREKFCMTRAVFFKLCK